jgi:hypothetical protein
MTNRSLVRFMEIGVKWVSVVVPARNWLERIVIDRSTLPKEVNEKIKPLYRCHARIDLEEKDPDKVVFTDWEP